jgi:hypothetical protein
MFTKSIRAGTFMLNRIVWDRIETRLLRPDLQLVPHAGHPGAVVLAAILGPEVPSSGTAAPRLILVWYNLAWTRRAAARGKNADMTSRHLDDELDLRHSDHRYDFSSRSLAGRVVLVPGGFGGLGAAVTAMLLVEGALPVVGYRSSRGHALALQQKLQDRYGGPVHLVEGDIRLADVRERYVETAFGIKAELYGLVTLTGDPARVAGDALDDESLGESLAANYQAPLLLARLAGREMVSHGTRGAIVFVSSMQGVHAFESSTAYAGPKAALIHAARI